MAAVALTVCSARNTWDKFASRRFAVVQTSAEPSSVCKTADPTSWSHQRPAIAPIKHQPSMPQ
jgi:hypothetical protein